ncbi:unnamed protein product [Urochloa humidicola]
MGKKKTFVLYPWLGVGHLLPMVELAKHLVRHGLAVVVAVVDSPDTDAGMLAAAVARHAAANPDISFRLLSAPISHDLLRRASPAPLRELLRSLPAVDALLLDMFCDDALDVAAELGIPAYFFVTSAAGDLACFLNLPYLYPTLPSFKGMGKALVHCPGMPPIRALDMVASMQDKESDHTKVRLHQFERIAEAKGVLVNSFDWLEPRALKALGEGVCVPGRPTPRAFCIGPLVSDGKTGETHECLAWLDAQPERSVVFLCFGSRGAFSAAQLQEIARGLESSGHLFLWAVRSPPEEQGRFPEPDLERLLPEGFLERTRGRGMVVKNWVPQAVGAFVTHCGWNSVLEGIMAGLPMICWPLYGEQGMNKVFMVEEMKIAVELQGYEELVKAEEVEAKVKMVMETEQGKILRERLALAREKAMEASKEGGSSEVPFDEFLNDLEKSMGSCVSGENATDQGV